MNVFCVVILNYYCSSSYLRCNLAIYSCSCSLRLFLFRFFWSQAREAMIWIHDAYSWWCVSLIHDAYTACSLFYSYTYYFGVFCNLTDKKLIDNLSWVLHIPAPLFTMGSINHRSRFSSPTGRERKDRQSTTCTYDRMIWYSNWGQSRGSNGIYMVCLTLCAMFFLWFSQQQ